MICWALSAISSASLLLVFLSNTVAYAALSDRIHDAVRAYIMANMPWRAEDIRMEFTGGPLYLEGIQERGARITIEKIGTEEYTGDMSFLVRLTDGRGGVRSVTVPVRMEVHADVVVAGHKLERNRILTVGDLRLKKKWLRRFDPQVATSLDQVVGKRLITPVAAGVEITTFMLKEPVLVRKGGVVRLQLERGPIEITTLGICEEDGVSGALVRVKNISSNRTVYAKVKGENHVVIDF